MCQHVLFVAVYVCEAMGVVCAGVPALPSREYSHEKLDLTLWGRQAQGSVGKCEPGTVHTNTHTREHFSIPVTAVPKKDAHDCLPCPLQGRNPELARVLLEEMRGLGHQPNRFCWNGVVNVHARTGDLEGGATEFIRVTSSRLLHGASTPSSKAPVGPCQIEPAP